MARSALSLFLLSARITFSYAYDWVGLPPVNGNPDNGWQQIPPLNNANLITNWPIPGTSSVFPVYQSSGLDPSQVTRAIIVPSGKDRDAWAYWTTIQNVKMDLASTDSSFNPNTTSILTPIFLADVDIKAGGGSSTQLYWSKSGWHSGEYAKGPNEGDKISSFAVMDALVNYYTNTTMYPNMQAVIFAGHSAAAQFFQHYAALRLPTTNDHRVNYIIANPGSYLWLVQDRPVQPQGECQGIDDYKYGLSGGKMPGYSTGDFKKNGRDGVVSRYLSRYVHYALGTADNGPGDTSCQAWTQGSTHLERGNNFINMLKNLPSGMPTTHTIDMIEGVSHQNDQMFNSTQLRQRLFKDVSTNEPLQTSSDPSDSGSGSKGGNSGNGASSSGSSGSSGSNGSNGALSSGIVSKTNELLGFGMLFALGGLLL
ncbi:hypothetical protein D9758_005562 [Tetrapyrgos nigripes]|uniref:Uncharacterized protein n=1 Tax=Tetrapyrgos nigripes TaxID=182062 RepID=A0A8H5GGX5_9AGAR|nr:hypothetical protein D9758_005562 [Tetrapyrgos nigripes]